MDRVLHRGSFLVARVPLGLGLLALYFCAAPFGYGAFALLALLPTRDREKRARLLQKIVGRAFYLMHRAFHTTGLLRMPRRRLDGHAIPDSAVLVANHPTLVDVTALVSQIDKIAVAVKPRLYKTFWVKPLLVQAAYFAGSDGSPNETARMLMDATDRLRRGYRVLFFPEGTRSPLDKCPGIGMAGANEASMNLHPLGRAAFEVAVRANVPVVPIVIRCEPRWLGKGRSIFYLPKAIPRLEVQALAPIHPSSVDGCSRTLKEVVTRALRNGGGSIKSSAENSAPIEPAAGDFRVGCGSTLTLRGTQLKSDVSVNEPCSHH